MQLRPRQSVFVDRYIAALRQHGSTLGIAPTGAGKTVILSGVAGRLEGAGLILQHRDELVTQNARTFRAVNSGKDVSIFDAHSKRWDRKGWTFGMVMTVARALDRLDPGDVPHVDALLVDEAHHTTANSYLKIIETLRRRNPDMVLGGVTATPQRGDKRGLAAVYRSVADEITLRELIEAGHLVRPRTFVVDLGVRDDLARVRKTLSDFDMDDVARIMDHSPLNDRVVDEWRKVAGDRQTVVFCATVAHAQHVAEAFAEAGARSAVVTGTMSAEDRRDTLARFDRGDVQVICNVAVLTEGWDCQPVSCVVLLRPSSYKSTMIQMVGRGLRKLDPERYPGVTKADCVVIDFGTSILTHGSIEADTATAMRDDSRKSCPECQAVVPDACPACPLCGYEWPKPEPKDDAGGAPERKSGERGALDSFVLTEVDLFNQSPFAWEELWPGVWMACSFESWAVVVHVGGQWFAVGGAKGGDRPGIHLLAARQPEKLTALASGDDWMRENGEPGAAAKTKRWLHLPASEKQVASLGLTPMQAIGVTRYRAACLLTWRWSERAIKGKVMGAMQ